MKKLFACIGLIGLLLAGCGATPTPVAESSTGPKLSGDYATNWIHIVHDDTNKVTCYIVIYSGDGISCIPDSQLEK